MDGAGSFAGTVFNCGMTERTVAATRRGSIYRRRFRRRPERPQPGLGLEYPGYDQLALMA